MIKLSHINKIINGAKILDDVSYTFEDGKIYAIIGESGSGKTTLLNIIGLVDFDYSGTYLIDRVVVNKTNANIVRNNKINYVYQKSIMFSKLSIFENVNIPNVLNRCKRTINEIENKILKLNIKSDISKNVSKFSGGEIQRISLARGILAKKQIMLLDESTSALDYKNQEVVEKELLNLKKDHIIILVTHDDELALRIADEIINIKDGKIIANKVETSSTSRMQTTPNNKLKLSDALLFGFSLIKSGGKRILTFVSMISGGLVGLVLSLSLCQGFLDYFQDVIQEDINKDVYVIEHKDESLISYNEIDYFVSKYKSYEQIACNVQNGIVCDDTSGKVYLFFNSKELGGINFEFRYDEDIESYKISSSIYDKLGDLKHLTLFGEDFEKKIVISGDLVFEEKQNVIISNNLDILSLLNKKDDANMYFIYSSKRINTNKNSIYNIKRPYDEYYEPLTKIISAIRKGIYVFCGISLFISILGVITITLLDILDRRRQIGLLQLQGWSLLDISKVFIAEIFVKSTLTIAITLFMSYIGIQSMNEAFNSILEGSSLVVKFDITTIFTVVLIVLAVMLVIAVFPLCYIYKKDMNSNLRN